MPPLLGGIFLKVFRWEKKTETFVFLLMSLFFIIPKSLPPQRKCRKTGEEDPGSTVWLRSGLERHPTPSAASGTKV